MKKIFILLVLLSSFMFSGFSALTDDNLAYYSFDDSTSEYNIFGATGTNEGMIFDGNDYISKNIVYDTDNLIVSMVINTSNVAQTSTLIGQYDTNSKRAWKLDLINDELGFVITPSGVSACKNWVTTSVNLNSNTEYLINFTFISGTPRLYVDNTEILSFTKTTDTACSNFFNTNADTLIGGVIITGTPTGQYIGKIGEVSINNNELFYSLSSSLNDSSGSENHATGISGVAYTNSSKLGAGAMSFDGVNDYIDTNYRVIGDDFTFSFWLKGSSAGVLYDNFQGSTNNFLRIEKSSTTAIRIDSGAGTRLTTAAYTLTNVTDWNHITYVRDSTANQIRLYVNGVNVQNTTDTRTGSFDTGVSGYISRVRNAAASFFTGDVDEYSIYNRTISSTEVSELYNSGAGYNPYSVSETGITFNNPTNNQYLNSLNFTLNVSFSETTNSTYSFNGGANTTLGTNTNNSTANLTGVEGLNNITVYTDTSGVLSNSSISFTIDTTLPSINNSIPSEINSYSFNGDWFSCSDVNLNTCQIEINNLTQNSGTNFSLVNNGNLSYTITATDLSGNSLNETGVVLVNPTAYIYFENSTGGTISNFTLNSVNFTDYANFSYYGDGLVIGENTLLFEKIGFSRTNITVNLSDSGTYNQSFTISNSKIILRIFDRENNSLVTDEVTITLIATQGYNSSTTTGLKNITDLNFFNEQYQLILESSNYATETVYFNFNNQEELNIDVYLLSLNATDYGFITVVAVADTGQFVQGAICKAMEWIPSSSSFLTRSEGQTNEQGQAVLNIEIGTKAYKFRCIKDGQQKDSISQIISSSGSTVTLVIPTGITQITQDFENLATDIYYNTFNTTHSRIFFDWTDSDNLVSQACLKVYKRQATTETYITQSCVSSSSGQIQILYETNNTYTLIFRGEVDDEPVETLVFLGSNSFSSQLKNYNLEIFLPLIFAILGFSAGLFMKPQNIYISILGTIIMTTISVFVSPTIISFSIAFIIWVICGLMLYGGSRK